MTVNTPSKKPQFKGFALVVTLSLMILLTIIAVGLLTLSSIALRSTSQGDAASTARSNARLAMMLALGELQASLGPDQNVSAPASSVIQNAARPHLTGAWSGWHWTPSTTGGPTYSDKGDQFRQWLVSSSDPIAAEAFGFASRGAPAGNNSAKLVGDLKDSQGISTQVLAEKVTVENNALPGKLAWAVFDESTKAAVNLGDSTNATDSALEIASRTAPDRAHADGLDSTLTALATPVNLVSLETAAIPVGSPSEIRKRFHDFTTSSLGLLTDTALGGLKTDLTALLEPNPRSGSDPLPSGAFERNTPYPAGFNTSDGAPTWAYFQSHYQKYKNLKMSGGIPTYDLTGSKARQTDLKVVRNGPGGKLTGLNDAPEIERMLPVIAKFQLAFSLVAHPPMNVGDRRSFLDSSGSPRGWTNYGVINLVYDPIITLYNPYDVTLDLSKTRIRIWDPPVGFRFTKNGVYFRPGGKFSGLAELQIDNDNNPDARKCFTLVLADGDGQRLNTSLQLKPGEVKVFSPRVEDSWEWRWEVAHDYAQTGTTFFDWDVNKNFGNVDNRSNARYGQFGVECAPGWDTRAGLQTDHLATSRSAPRSAESKYPFESGRNDGFVTMKKTDLVKAEVRPLVRSGRASTQFQVDVLAGVRVGSAATGVNSDTNNTGEIGDTLRSYRFNFTGLDPSDELSADPSNPIIASDAYRVSDIFQPETGQQTGWKKPFAMLEMTARTTKDTLTDNKPWLYNNVVVEGGIQDTKVVGLSNQSYDLRLIEMTSFDGFPGGIDIDPDTFRGYFGATGSVNEGSSFVNMLHIPLAPAASLGDLISANLAASSLLPRVVHPFGNSYAHPLIPASGVSESLGNVMMDHSYLLNDALWDSYYFSSITDYGDGVISQKRSILDVLGGVFDGSEPAINSRIVPATTPGDADAMAQEVAGLGDVERSRQLAKYVAVSGPFNVNSTSVDAWRAVLSGMRERAITGLEFDASGQTLSTTSYSNNGATPFVRAGKPVAGPTAPNFLRWSGFRALTDTQIEDLATRIVTEITNRGKTDSAPSLTLGEFVNRRIGSSGSLAGLLQTAIDQSTINSSSLQIDSKPLNASSIVPKRKKGAVNAEAMDGDSAAGAPTMITQGDLMAALAPIATVRGDTFKIRSYGEATTANGTTVLARAWCEAVVQRVPDFVDPIDPAETAIAASSKINRTFGRRFNIVSFRWLGESEL